MRFGLVHRLMTNALATLGVLAIVNTAGMPPWTAAAVLGGLAVAVALPESLQVKPFMRTLATLGPLALFVIEVLRVIFGASALDIAVEFAGFLQVLRVATRRGAAHDQQIIILALLHFVAGTVLGGGLAYGLCFVGFLIVAPGALVLSHLRREVEGNYRQGARDRTGLPVDVPRILRSRRVVGRGFLLTTCLLSLPIFVFTGALFILFPRIGLSLLLVNHTRSGRMVGFSDHVDLGDVGTLRSDPTVALRFTLPDTPDPPLRMTIRLRGTAFDTYDGRAWSRSVIERHPIDLAYPNVVPILRLPRPAQDRRISFDLEPIDPPVLFLPPQAVAAQLRLPTTPGQQEGVYVSAGPEGELRYASPSTHGVRYDVFLAGSGEVVTQRLAPTDRSRYLTLPPLPPRIGELARAWTANQPTPLAKAKAIEEHLRNDFHYDVTSPSGGKPQPLDHFLFETKRGHCEFFSTAMVMMLREVGIPARNVTGFVGGTYNRFGKYYAVREGDAHSWVEAHLEQPHPAWVTFDPTPTAAARPLQETGGAYLYVRDFVEAVSQRWNRYVVGYDLGTQVRLFEAANRSYNQARSRAGLTQGLAGQLTRAPVLAGIVVALGVVAYWVWRRQRPKDPATGKVATPKARAALLVIELYQSLDAALAARGLARAPSTPPLRYAEDLRRRSHPLAEDVHAMTLAYLAVRFGGASLDPLTKRTFEEGIRAVRAFREPPPPERASRSPARALPVA
ncbi:MAG: DUF3488 domain-containing protein [Myxococcales bacterium]|nr:DUF3488 domain-containing protein [Myxococcales bacterium]HQY59990.1 transglutaminaseTgpA domain-containing protein [Polyangiaceae bacterium]